MPKNGKIRMTIVALSVLGMIMMSYLVYLHYAPSPEGGSFCDISEEFSCDTVNKSAYSEIFGIPMSVFGVFYFGIVTFLALLRYTAPTIIFIAFFLIALLGPSLYLSVSSKLVLGSMCILCEFSKVLMALIALLSIYAVGPRNFGLNRTVLALSLALALAGVMYFIYSWIITDPFTYMSNISLWDLFK